MKSIFHHPHNKEILHINVLPQKVAICESLLVQWRWTWEALSFIDVEQTRFCLCQFMTKVTSKVEHLWVFAWTVNMRSGVTLRHTICHSKALPGLCHHLYLISIWRTASEPSLSLSLSLVKMSMGVAACLYFTLASHLNLTHCLWAKFR